MKQRVVVMAHGHPKFSKGGGEHAAHALFRALNQQDNFEAWFVATAPERHLAFGEDLGSLNSKELLIRSGSCYFFNNSAIELDSSSGLMQWFQQVNPTAIHLHHFINLGVELILALRAAFPKARFILTLHEFLLLCPLRGQLLRRDGRLCQAPDLHDCLVCLPDRSANDLLMRQVRMQALLTSVDHMISPSEHLAQQFLRWGVDESMISVIENPLGDGLESKGFWFSSAKETNSVSQRQASPGRFAYFGQIHPAKGLDLILQALRLALVENPQLQLTIHGTDIYGPAHPDPMVARHFSHIRAEIRLLQPQVLFHGPYDPSELPALMAEQDWVVMGSRWGENSPVVIQEAMSQRRPLLVPGFGGMAEKVRPGLDGFHYTPRSASALACTMLEAASSRERWLELVSTQAAGPDDNEIIHRHLNLYYNTRGL